MPATRILFIVTTLIGSSCAARDQFDPGAAQLASATLQHQLTVQFTSEHPALQTQPIGRALRAAAQLIVPDEADYLDHRGILQLPVVSSDIKVALSWLAARHLLDAYKFSHVPRIPPSHPLAGRPAVTTGNASAWLATWAALPEPLIGRIAITSGHKLRLNETVYLVFQRLVPTEQRAWPLHTGLRGSPAAYNVPQHFAEVPKTARRRGRVIAFADNGETLATMLPPHLRDMAVVVLDERAEADPVTLTATAEQKSGAPYAIIGHPYGVDQLLARTTDPQQRGGLLSLAAISGPGLSGGLAVDAVGRPLGLHVRGDDPDIILRLLRGATAEELPTAAVPAPTSSTAAAQAIEDHLLDIIPLRPWTTEQLLAHVRTLYSPTDEQEAAVQVPTVYTLAADTVVSPDRNRAVVIPTDALLTWLQSEALLGRLAKEVR